MSYLVFRSNLSKTFFKIGVLKNLAKFRGKYMCWSPFLIKLQASANLLQETPVQVFSSKFYKLFKKNVFAEHLRTTALIYVFNFNSNKSEQT